MKLYEFAAPLIFYGLFAQNQALQKAAAIDLNQLENLGYDTQFLAKNPIKVMPLEDHLPGAFSAHGALFKPGHIYLRANPSGPLSARHYLRHELAHAVSHHQCQGKLPMWAEESFALFFQQQLDGGHSSSTAPTPQAIAELKKRIRNGAPMTQSTQATLAKLVVQYGGSPQPCKPAKALKELLDQPAGHSFSYRITSLVSGRPLRITGDQHTRYPPGSLLKIPYIASLRTSDLQHHRPQIARHLLASSAEGFEDLLPDVSLLRKILGAPGATLKIPKSHSWPEAFLGLRGPNGSFLVKMNLDELSQTLRTSILLRGRLLRVLEQNGKDPQSTLYGASPRDLKWLDEHQVLAKTGTVSSGRGLPQWGYLALAWPADAPAFLMVSRQKGVSGKVALTIAVDQLRQFLLSWQNLSPKVAIHVMGRLPPSSWQLKPSCDLLAGSWGEHQVDFSTCAQLDVLTPASKVKRHRHYHGLLVQSKNPQTGLHPPLLLTDPLTYAEGVVAAEADALHPNVKEALWAITLWNTAAGHERGHHQRGLGVFSGLCDTTHCGVYLGDALGPPLKERLPPTSLLQLLSEINAPPWLMYEKGGQTPWSRIISQKQLVKSLNMKVISLNRLRLRDASVIFHAETPQGRQTFTCEHLRLRLGLPSCPNGLVYLQKGQKLQFEGIGEGHGQGMNLMTAQRSALAGASSAALLRAAYDKRIVSGHLLLPEGPQQADAGSSQRLRNTSAKP